MRKQWKQWHTFIFLGPKISADGDWSHEIKRQLLLGRKIMTNLDSILKQRNDFVNKCSSSQSYGFSIVMYGCESWTIKKAEHWRTDAFELRCLEKTLESPLDCKEIKPVNPKGYQSWISIGRTNDEAEAPMLWTSDVKNWLIGKDPNAGKDWRQEKWMTEMRWLNGITDSTDITLMDKEAWRAAVHGVSKESAMTEWLNWIGYSNGRLSPETRGGDFINACLPLGVVHRRFQDDSRALPQKMIRLIINMGI